MNGVYVIKNLVENKYYFKDLIKGDGVCEKIIGATTFPTHDEAWQAIKYFEDGLFQIIKIYKK